MKQAMSDVNYQATVVEISNKYDLPGLDNLKGTNIFGNQVLIGKDTEIGTIGIYFPLESQLGEEFCIKNDLIRRKDENGKVLGGMFDANRRVRAIKLKGNPSMGFWIPISSLSVAGVKKLPDVGESFNLIEGIDISKKYVSARNKSGNSGLPNKKQMKRYKISRIVDNQFRFHFDTLQFGKNAHRLQWEDIISITWKFHGTSAIASRVLAKMTDVSRLKHWMVDHCLGSYKIDYDYLYASRQVIKNSKTCGLHFYGHDLWTDVGSSTFGGKLHKGETVYYEIVGYVNGQKMIQKGYDYGCAVGTCKPYVYRITMTNVDGVVTELPFPLLKERCVQLGASPVEEIFYGKVEDFIPYDPSRYAGVMLQEHLVKTCVSGQDSAFCKNKVPEEGVVVRKEGLVIESYKLKSFAFLKRETEELDKCEENIEDSQEESVVDNA